MGPGGKQKLQAELGKIRQDSDDFANPLKKKPLYKKGPLHLAAVSGDDDNKGDEKKDKKQSKEDKKKSKIDAANAKKFKTQDVDLTT